MQQSAPSHIPANQPPQQEPQPPPPSSQQQQQQRQNNGVRLVVQRCLGASLLLEEASGRRAEVGRGLVVLVSLGEGSSSALVSKAADAVLQLPLSTTGEWGDGSKSLSALKVRMGGQAQSVLLIPQACLTSEARGRSLKYHKQLERTLGARLFCELEAALSGAAQRGLLELAFRHEGAFALLSPLLPADLAFGAHWGAYDARGVPTHDRAGQELPKAERKRLDTLWKLLDGALRAAAPLRAARALVEQARRTYSGVPEAEAELARLQQDAPADALRAAAHSPIDVVAGTFGGRQGLRLDAELGPSTHVLSFD
jgi:hypothetical protein